MNVLETMNMQLRRRGTGGVPVQSKWHNQSDMHNWILGAQLTKRAMCHVTTLRLALHRVLVGASTSLTLSPISI